MPGNLLNLKLLAKTTKKRKESSKKRKESSVNLKNKAFITLNFLS